MQLAYPAARRAREAPRLPIARIARPALWRLGNLRQTPGAVRKGDMIPSARSAGCGRALCVDGTLTLGAPGGEEIACGRPPEGTSSPNSPLSVCIARNTNCLTAPIRHPMSSAISRSGRSS